MLFALFWNFCVDHVDTYSVAIEGSFTKIHDSFIQSEKRESAVRRFGASEKVLVGSFYDRTFGCYLECW